MKRTRFLAALVALPFAPHLITEARKSRGQRDLRPYQRDPDLWVWPPDILPVRRVGNYTQISSKTLSYTLTDAELVRHWQENLRR